MFNHLENNLDNHAVAPTHIADLPQVGQTLDGGILAGVATLADEARLVDAGQPQQSAWCPGEDIPEEVLAAVAEAIGDAYDCIRHWSAWSYGTMGPDDFHLVAENDDRVTDIAHAALSAALASNTAPGLTQAARDILAERQRQIDVEGWTPEHDDGHTGRELARAAACYAIADGTFTPGLTPPLAWPWDPSWFKPRDTRSNLVRAAALILAEIERLDRAALAAKGGA